MDLSVISKLSPEEQRNILSLIDQLDELRSVDRAKTEFMPFVKRVWPSFIEGRHHKIMADAFQRVADGKLKRLIICMAPRHSKSEFGSYLLPAWYLGRYPHKKIIQASHTSELAVGFGRKVRNLVKSEEYQTVFPGTSLRMDSKAAGRWNTGAGGEYFAVGTGGAVTGKGADCAYFSCRCLTKNGYVQIADIRVGDEVWAYDHKRKTQRWARVEAISTGRKPKIIEVCGLRCTPEHRIYTGTGYERADRARQAAVLPLRGDVREGATNPHAAIQTLWAESDPGLLLKSVRSNEDAGSGLRLWELESFARVCMQKMLPVWKVFGAQVRSLWLSIHAAFFRNKEGLGSRPFWEILRQAVLQRLPHGAPGDISNDRLVQKMLKPYPGREGLLLHEVLRGEGGQPGLGIYWEMEHGASADEGALRRGLLLLREDKAARSRSSYRSQREEPQEGEPGPPVRAVPQPLSSQRIGTCARDLEKDVQGDGHWVVDLQTDTENFFCEGVLAHNCLIIDDAISEQDAISGTYSNEVYKKTYEWYISGPRQRLQPNGSIIIINTRWSMLDLTGQLLKRAAEKDEPSEWEVIEFPAIMPSGAPLWPEFWSLDELLKIKADISPARWNAQYMQQPTAEEGAIIKRDWWKRWDSPTPPKCESILLSFDTAYLKTQRANYSACTTWGVFMGGDVDKPVPNLILLDAWRDKVEFPELKTIARKLYREKRPDMVIIETRAAGAPLIFELRAMGIPVSEFTPARGQDKIARANAVTDLFKSGMVWAPETRWADEVVEECAQFPHGENDDYLDTVTQALLRFRQGGIVKTSHDEEDKPIINRRIADYY